MYISDPESFQAFIERASKASFIAIDTEFLREKTYYATLCLIQVATKSEVAIIDPFTVGSLQALAKLFENERITKVFHACDQDIEILYREVGVMPKPLFDTQMAAALLGHPKQISYAALVKCMCGVTLKKADSYTDWAARPLSKSQITYAADDVIYLAKMYEPMVQKLNKLNRLSWLTNDFEALCNPKRFEVDPQTRYSHLKHGNKLFGRQLCIAREVAAWREQCAQKRNIPRKWVLTDEQVVEICKRESRSIDDLFMVRGVRERLSTRDAREVVSVIRHALSLPKNKWPRSEHFDKNERNVDVEVRMMEALLFLRARESGVAPLAIASTSDLAQFARSFGAGSELLSGWKYELVGRELEQLLKGELYLCFEQGKVAVKKHSQHS